MSEAVKKRFAPLDGGAEVGAAYVGGAWGVGKVEDVGGGTVRY